MPRPARARPLGEHVAVLARVLRQVEANKTLRPTRARKIKRALATALEEFQREMAAS